MSSKENIKAKSVVEAVIEAIPAPVFYKHEDGRYLGCNTEFEQFVGKTKAELLGKTVFELWEPELAKVYHEADQALFNKGGRQIYEAQVKFADGCLKEVLFHKAVFNVEGELNGLVGVMLDVTARNNAERLLREAAETDSLTGLSNRAFFYDQFPQVLSEASSSGANLALLALDLDHFKDANDCYGHLVGDQILIQAARRLKNSIREDDLIARIGGDEFLILLKNIPSEEQANAVAENILGRVAGKPFEISGESIDIGISIGILHSLSSEHPMDELIHQADKALYRAKQIRNTVST